jgi:hypothetical protein
VKLFFMVVPFFGFGDPIPFGTDRNRHLHFKEFNSLWDISSAIGAEDRIFLRIFFAFCEGPQAASA